MEKKNQDAIKEALAQAAAQSGHALPEAIKEALKSKERTELEKQVDPETIKELEVTGPPKRDKTAVLVVPAKKRTEPIWPMDDEQLIQWRKDMEKRETLSKIPKKEEELTPERKAEIQALAIEAARLARPSRAAAPIKEKVVKEPRVKEKKSSGRQQRLGQTKLIDELLKQGKTEKEIFDTVREKIPDYPADKLPKLIKLRQYHVKKS